MFPETLVAAAHVSSVFPSFATQEAFVSRKQICFCYTAETFFVSARHGSMAKRGNNYGNRFLETCFLILPGLKARVTYRVTMLIIIIPLSVSLGRLCAELMKNQSPSTDSFTITHAQAVFKPFPKFLFSLQTI